MVVKNREKNLTVKAKFEKNATVRVEIPQDNAIRRINLHCKIVTNAGATPAVGIKNGNILNAIKRMQVKLNGTDDIFDLDLRTYFDVLTYEYGTKPYLDAFAIPVATKSSNDEIEIPIDFALIRNQISDYSALLPAQLLDSVELLITWGDIGDIVTTANTATIASSTEIALSLIEVYETTSNLDALNDIMGSLTKVYEGVEQTSITQAYASYPADELPIQVRPVPARHLAHLMIALKNITDGNPAPDNDIISYVKLENVQGGGEAIFLGIFKYLNHGQKLDYALESDNVTGRVYFDWTDIRNGNLTNLDVDAIKYKILAVAPAATKVNAVRIYKKFISAPVA